MSTQRFEQNGLNAGSTGLPQIGQARALTVLWSISFILRQPPDLEQDLGGASHRVQPAEANRIALAAQQRNDFVERQANNVAI